MKPSGLPMENIFQNKFLLHRMIGKFDFDTGDDRVSVVVDHSDSTYMLGMLRVVL